MSLTKLRDNKEVTLPDDILRDLALGEDTVFTVEKTKDGAILLRPVGVYELESYTDERLAELLEGNELPNDLEKDLETFLAKKR
jgi:antitoxin component of MazEF toxin-antitoxin module